MFRKTEVFIISQPFFPVPAVNDGAISFLIQDTIDCLIPREAKVISIWDERMASLGFDRNKYHFVNRKSLFLRLAKKILASQVNSRLVYKMAYTKYLDMLFSVIWYAAIDKPKALIVHTTRCEWVINLKKIFSGLNMKIAWYHHMSEDQNSDVEHLSKFDEIDAHIFVSNHSREKFIEKVFPYDKLIANKCYVVKNGVNLTHFSKNRLFRKVTRDSYKIQDDMVSILYVGKVIPRKGFHKLLDAVNLLPENIKRKIAVLVVGAADYYVDNETEYILEIRKRTENIGAKFHFVGYVPHGKIVHFYSAADLLVFPSIEEEGMPLTIIEAQAMGLPVISSNVGGISEVVIHNETGIIYEYDANPAVLTRHLVQLIGSPSLRMRFAKRAEENIKADFSREMMAKNFQFVIKSLLNE